MSIPSITLEVAPVPSNHMLASGRSYGITRENLDEAIALYTPQQQDVLLFWWDTGKDRGWGLAELYKQTGVSSTTLTRLFQGIYQGSVPEQITKLQKAREQFGESVDNPDFIMTSLAGQMFKAFDKTRALKNVTIMWGKMGIGKSTVELEYTRQNNHGQTYYVRCPGHGCTIFQFVQHVSKSMRISINAGTVSSMRDRIAAYLSKGNRLLIVDELHEIFRTCTPLTIIRICEWLREVQETAQCGLALTGTELLQKEFFHGVHKDILAQLVDRGTVQIALSSKPTKGDVVAFLRHYGLQFPGADQPVATQLVNDIIASNGLRKLTLHLRDGKAYSIRRQEPYTWDHFVAAFEAIQSLGKHSNR